MRFVADLHIHSHLSRATSKDLDLEHLHGTAQKKGVTALGTGDFTHPRWFAELREKLVPAEPGLFALRPDLARAVDERVPGSCRGDVRFLLQVEISNIYKRDGKVRKVHNLVFAPDLESAAKITSKLAALGNVESDGRPILGLDSRDLLEIVLEASPDAFLIPAHVWTPWFSALGAQSGFDAVEECYADLAPHIFAVETGLSSDPAMNWRLSQLDRYALVSSSDAHSPEKLGREANLFECDLSYYALRDALRRPRTGFLGTLEFFPEEGKYHFDGHRKCGVVLAPGEARALEGLCPKCGKRVTGGVMNRIDALADRPDGFRPPGAPGFHSLVQLEGVLSEVVGVGAGSERVRGAYEKLLRKLGPELVVLREAPLDDIGREGPPLLAEALRRMRAGAVKTQPGYDGEYGVIRLFDEAERRALLAQRAFAFFEAPGAVRASEPEAEPESALAPVAASVREAAAAPTTAALNPEQAAVVAHASGPLCVIAGPGTGKTRTIVERIASLVRDSGVSPRAITALSFTRKAAAELGERLVARLGTAGRQVAALTFHALGLELLRSFAEAAGLARGFRVLDEPARRALTDEIAAVTADFAGGGARLSERLSWAKAHLEEPDTADPDLRAAFAAYERALRAAGAVDFDDLVLRAVRLLEASDKARAWAEARCRYLFVDEYQDINAAQDRLVRLLAAAASSGALDDADLCVVGDPDQAIYGFRGADPSHFDRFTDAFPRATTICLTRNYRSPAVIVNAATAVISAAVGRAPRPLVPDAAPATAEARIHRFVVGAAADEAELIAAEIERAVGGTSLTSFDTGRAEGHTETGLAFHDIAVLTRTAAQQDAIAEALDRATIPYRRIDDAPLGGRAAVARLVGTLDRLRAGTSASPLRADVGMKPVTDLVMALAAGDPVSPEERRAAELLAALALPYRKDLARFLAELPLLREIDVALEPQKVALLTLHASKGLEFPLVFIAGCERGLLPLELPGLASNDLEEERRLLYVGMTRAQQRLVLLAVRKRTLFGRTLEPAACPFFETVPRALLADHVSAPRRRSARQLGLF